MKLQFFAPRWGSEHINWDEFILKAKNEGYDGIEYGISVESTTADLDIIWEKLSQHQMFVIPQYYGTHDGDFNRQFDNFSAWLEMLKPYPALQIDSQTGRDFFTFDQNKKLIDLALKHTRECGVEVFHETHRNKALFAAHTSKQYLENIPELKITLDVSHWVNVAESYLEDQQSAVNLAISRTGHVHARVGYPEGPQVPDPRIPEWQEAVNYHLSWWDKIAELIQAKNEVLTITPEFGPYPYMVHLPGNNLPISNQWEVNCHIKDLLQKRYS